VTAGTVAAAVRAAGQATATAAGTRMGVPTGEVPHMLPSTVPAVTKEVIAAAAQGLHTELDLAKRRRGDAAALYEILGAQFAEEEGKFLAVLDDWVGMVTRVAPTAAATESVATVLMSHVSKLALTGLDRPVGFSCNDPMCGNLQGLSEVGLVLPRVMKGTRRGEGAGVCERCKAACYCSKLCQRCHKGKHRAICGPPVLLEAAATGGGGQALPLAGPQRSAAAGTGAVAGTGPAGVGDR
jgi:hypothetical protein